MKRKFTLAAIQTLLFLSAFSKHNSVKQDKDSLPFYLVYSFAGIGSNMGTFQPVIRIHDTSLVYTYEQNSQWGERNTKIDTVCMLRFRQTSIDSIYETIRGLPDTTIFKSHLGIMSGGIHFLTVKNGNDTINFHMMNTFDYTALKIANILNSYLPKDNQIWANEKMIVDSEKYQADFLKKLNAGKLKKRKKQHRKSAT